MFSKKTDKFYINVLNSVINCGVKGSDSSEQKLKKQIITLLPVIIGIAAAVWGSIYSLLGHYLSASIPLSYSVISLFSLFYFAYSKNIAFLQTSQLILVLILPFLLMWSLGGFSSGSYVMIWAFYAPLAAMTFSKQSRVLWFSLFLLLTLISALIDNILVAAVEPLPYVAVTIFSVLNIGAGFGGIFYIMNHYLNEKDSISFQLEELNRELEKKIAYAVAQNEETNKLLISQSKLASMGEMISMIAHQWRQPLSSISTIASNLQIKIALKKYDEEQFNKKLGDISSVTQHLSNTINDFRNFFKPDKNKNKFLIVQSIENALSLSESMFKSKHISVEKQFHTNKEIYSYENELIQAILNIFTNAIDALVEHSVKNPKIIITVLEDDSKNILITIEDNGGGIEDSIATKIFEPYFSTKAKNGTGLGLYMSKSIIEEHCGGKLTFCNTEDGAKFTISVSDTL